MNLIQLTLAILTASTIASFGVIVLVRARGRDGLHLRTWLVVDFVITYIVSGFVHVLQLTTSRGYYEALPGNPHVDTSGLLVAAWCTPVALAGLALGLSVRWIAPPKYRRQQPYSMAIGHRMITTALGLGLTAFAGLGVMRIRGVASSGERVIGVDGGMARFAFLASWMPWGITLLALLLLARRKQPGNDMWNTLVLGGASGVIAVAGSWAGGRTDVVVFTLPLLIVVLPWLRGLRTPLLVGGMFAVFAFVRLETLNRAGSQGGFDVASLLDWQWGRFSMVAWAGAYAEQHGFIAGETMASGFLAVPFAVLHLVGIPGGDGRTIVQITGEYFSGAREFIHVVPGMSAELYLNFGYLGVFGGYVILGLVGALVADIWLHSQTELGRVLIVYLAAILLFQSLTAQSGASGPLVFMTGAPMMMLFLLELLLRRDDEIRARRVHDPFVPLGATSLFGQWNRRA